MASLLAVFDLPEAPTGESKDTGVNTLFYLFRCASAKRGASKVSKGCGDVVA
jgi:hypothetical protein